MAHEGVRVPAFGMRLTLPQHTNAPPPPRKGPRPLYVRGLPRGLRPTM
jgi:hypothetical protein